MQGFGPFMLLGLFLMLALVLTHFIDNPATAVILAPLGYQMALELRVDPYPFLVALAICISASFSTPIAHESTILVMAPGRYRFKHYLQIGGRDGPADLADRDLLRPRGVALSVNRSALMPSGVNHCFSLLRRVSRVRRRPVPIPHAVIILAD